VANEKRAVTADTALRLARYFGTTPEFWMNLQAAFDLRSAAAKSRSKIESEVLPRAA
jgi:addiction module HigA family antidote